MFLGLGQVDIHSSHHLLWGKCFLKESSQNGDVKFSFVNYMLNDLIIFFVAWIISIFAGMLPKSQKSLWRQGWQCGGRFRERKLCYSCTRRRLQCFHRKERLQLHWTSWQATTCREMGSYLSNNFPGKSVSLFGLFFFQTAICYWHFLAWKQMNAGAVMLTDCVFWFVLVPFLAIKDYHLTAVSIWIILELKQSHIFFSSL